MTLNDIILEIKKKESFLCVGLDTDINKIPDFFKNISDPIFAFNKAIIDATAPYAIAFKPNVAFYEAYGTKGWESLQKTAQYIKTTYPNIFLIADAKRGDIGNTSTQYAKAFFEKLPFDAITVSPYMGSDSIQPFLEYKNKFVIILALTSNTGAYDFQYFKQDNQYLFERVLQISQKWADYNQIMYVIGATQAEMLKTIRNIVPHHFLLIPGIGTQGGNLDQVAQYGINQQCGLIVNSSRSIIFASNNKNFDAEAAYQAKLLQQEMRKILLKYNIL